MAQHLLKDDSDPNGIVNYQFTTENALACTKEALTCDYGLAVDQVEAVAPDVDASMRTIQQSTIFGLANLFAANNNLGLYG
jgi:hypothetical protein